jgi:hypothetical protein
MLKKLYIIQYKYCHQSAITEFLLEYLCQLVHVYFFTYHKFIIIIS